MDDLGFRILSTGGTARLMREEGVEVTDVSDHTGFPEMMDGRVKTLHPAVHGGILARRHRPDDLEALEAQGIVPIDVVVVNLYPFARAAADPGTEFDALIEEIDIGGPTLVRAAAKHTHAGNRLMLLGRVVLRRGCSLQPRAAQSPPRTSKRQRRQQQPAAAPPGAAEACFGAERKREDHQEGALA